MNHNSLTPLILQADPRPPSCPPPSLVRPLITQCSPLWLLSFHPHPCPPPFFLLFMSNFHSPGAAQGVFSFQRRAKKSCDKVVRVCVGSLSHATPEFLYTLSPQKLFQTTCNLATVHVTGHHPPSTASQNDTRASVKLVLSVQP